MDAVINSFLERLLATSLQTALLATAVWMLCRLVPRLSPASQCWLWWLVALQAVLGLVLSPVEIPLLQYASAVLPETSPAVQWDPAIPAAAIPPPALVTAKGHIWITWQLTAFLLWMAGALIMAWFTMRDWRRGKTLVNYSAPCDDEDLLQALAGVARTCGTRNPPELRLSADIESPVLVGHRRAVLLLPATTSMSDEELDMALAHELTHLRRGDLWWGAIPALARHLFFFHPFAHLVAREYEVAREAACDAVVVHSGQRSRKDYGSLLVRLGATPASRTGLAVASPTFRSLKRRLTMLQYTSFLSRAASSIVVSIVAITGVVPIRVVAATGNRAATVQGSEALAGASMKEQIPETQNQPMARAFPLPCKRDLTPQERAQRKTSADSFGKLNDLELWKKSDAASETRELYQRQEAEHEKLFRDSEEYRCAVYEAVAAQQGDPVVGARMKAEAENRLAVIRRTNPDTHPQDNSEGSGHRPNDINTLAAAALREEADVRPDQSAVLRSRRAELEKKLDELLLVYKDTHPEIFRLRTQLRELYASDSAQMPDAQDAYRIGQGDSLQISVWEHPELGVELPVRPDGRISTPLVEDVIAVGKTPTQLARDIETKLRQFLRSPKVVVIMKTIAVRSPKAALQIPER